MLTLQIDKGLPIWKFFYRGNKSHPVRRTILKIKEDSRVIVGYELRCGAEIRSLKDAPICTYEKDKIANIRNLRRDNKLRRKAIRGKKSQSRSTLVNCNLLRLLNEGL